MEEVNLQEELTKRDIEIKMLKARIEGLEKRVEELIKENERLKLDNEIISSENRELARKPVRYSDSSPSAEFSTSDEDLTTLLKEGVRRGAFKSK